MIITNICDRCYYKCFIGISSFTSKKKTHNKTCEADTISLNLQMRKLKHNNIPEHNSIHRTVRGEAWVEALKSVVAMLKGRYCLDYKD